MKEAIEEAKSKKRVAEEKIMAILREFEEETSTSCSKVSVEKRFEEDESGIAKRPYKTYIVDVRILVDPLFL